MDQKDREMLIRIDENVIQLKRAVPELSKKVQRHENFFLVIFVFVIVCLAKIKGGFEIIRAFFE